MKPVWLFPHNVSQHYFQYRFCEDTSRNCSKLRQYQHIYQKNLNAAHVLFFIKKWRECARTSLMYGALILNLALSAIKADIRGGGIASYIAVTPGCKVTNRVEGLIALF